ncbi:MAG: TIGR03067 domain-containing protein [Gemmataceae bacterium]|nr:TIGR03067 domain-containing protein [Gemmataceae bacterium]
MNCLRIVAAVAFAFVIANSAVAQGKATLLPEAELGSKLQGNWVASSMNKEGVRVPDAEIEKLTAEFWEDQFSMSPRGGRTGIVRFRIDASQKLVRFDVARQAGFDKIEIQHGIIEWNGDSLRIALSLATSGPGSRPTDFSPKPGVLTLNLRRPIQ